MIGPALQSIKYASVYMNINSDTMIYFERTMTVKKSGLVWNSMNHACFSPHLVETFAFNIFMVFNVFAAVFDILATIYIIYGLLKSIFGSKVGKQNETYMVEEWNHNVKIHKRKFPCCCLKAAPQKK